LTAPPTSSSPASDGAASSASLVTWADPARADAFHAWLTSQAPAHGLQLPSLVLASADASFRRYLRIDSVHGSRIIMDAPPDKEDCRPFEHVARLMAQAGLRVPEVLAWDQTNGFMLLSDLGTHTMMQVMNREEPQANFDRYMQAVDALITWQLASKPNVLPDYTEAVLRRELALFPEWYLTRHRGVVVEGEIKRTLDEAFNHIVAQNLAWPSVYVHRDFMPRNLMVSKDERSAGPPQASSAPLGGSAPREAGSVGARLGVLDFQDALYGPITYDIATLMRDAFLTWDEDFVLDITIRYWQKARKAGLPVGDDFGEFYRGVEWMGIQRHLKVAGIFARLTLRDGKPQYLADAPRFIHYIRSTANRYRELRPLQRMVDQIEGIQEQTGFAYGRM
jgi:aminoglycoside/choline kinase family phosphotransferase